MKSISLLCCLTWSCAGALTATPEELAMTTHPLAAEGAALVLERKGIMILSYSEQTDDFTGSGREFHQAMSSADRKPGPGPMSGEALASEAAQTLVAAGVESYSLEVVERIKILTAEGELVAKRQIQLPEDSELEEVEGRVFLPDGSVHELVATSATVEDGILRFELPGATVGAVASYRYKVRTSNLASFHSWRFQGDLPILASSFRLRFKKGTEIPVRIESTDPGLRPRYHLKVGESTSKTQVKAWAIWELADVPATATNTDPVALVVGM